MFVNLFMTRDFRVDLQRAQNIDSSLISDIFRKTTEELSYLLTQIILSSSPDPKLIDSVKRYMVIRLVSSMDVFVKQIVRKSIDEWGKDPTKLKDKITINVDDLNTIIKNNQNMTIGKILASVITVNNLDDVWTPIKVLHDIDMKGEILKHNNDDKPNMISLVGIETIFKARHELIHVLKDPEKFDQFELLNMFTHTLSLMDFIHNKLMDSMTPKK